MSNAHVTNAANEGQLERAKVRIETEEQRRALAWKRLLETTDGRIVIEDLVDYCGLFRSPRDFENPRREAYLVAQQDVARYIVAQVTKHNERALLEMLQANLAGRQK